MKLSLVIDKLSTIEETVSPVQNTMPLRTQPVQQTQSTDQSSDTRTWTPPPTPSQNGQSTLNAYQTLQQIKSDHLQSLTIDQKLELALQKTISAEKTAYQALRQFSELDMKLDKVFKELSGAISKVSSGKPQQDYGSSIFDNGQDPESIM